MSREITISVPDEVAEWRNRPKAAMMTPELREFARQLLATPPHLLGRTPAAAEHQATLMTAERNTVNRVRAEGWPIIDLCGGMALAGL